MERRWAMFLSAVSFVLFLMLPSLVSAAEEPLVWEYWVEDTLALPSEPAKMPPDFQKGTGQWRVFQPQFGVAVPDGTHYVWIRVYIPPSTSVDDSLFFSTTDQSLQVFLDGVSIYRYGDLREQAFSYGRKWHLVDLPAWAVGRHLVMQVYSDNQWVLGQFDRVRMERASHLIEQLFLFDFPYVSGITALAIFMLLLGVYFFTEKNQRDLYIRLLVVLAAFCIWMLSSSSLMLLWLDWPVFWWQVELNMSYLIPLSANLLIYGVIDAPYKKRIASMSAIYGGLYGAAVVLEIIGMNGMYFVRFFF